MKINFKRPYIFIIALVFLAAKCEVPEVTEYAELTKEMDQSIRQTATSVIDFLGKGYYERKQEVPGIEDEIWQDMAGILNKDVSKVNKDYPSVLRNSWNQIFYTLDELVGYADALSSIKESGEKGEESFENLANSLESLLDISGFGTAVNPVSEIGKFAYGKLAKIKAAKSLETVIVPTDEIIQIVAIRLDSALLSMQEVNDVAESENLLVTIDSKESQRLINYYRSLEEKEKVNIDKLILLNNYDNGDRLALDYFVYKDPQSLDKLGIESLKEELDEILSIGALSPKEKLDSIETLVKGKYKTQVDNALNNSAIVSKIDLSARLAAIQSDLKFIRTEKNEYETYYNELMETEKTIVTTANINRNFITTSRSAIKTWARNHSQMKTFFKDHQTLSFEKLKLYVEDIKELGTRLNNLKNTDNATDTP